MLELFGNDRIVLAQPLLRISTSCKAVSKRVFQGKDASSMSNHAKPLLKASIFSKPEGVESDSWQRKPWVTLCSPQHLQVRWRRSVDL